MSQEEAESSIIYEEPIDIPLEDDDDEDELEEENSVPLSSQADQENAENESDDSVDNLDPAKAPPGKKVPLHLLEKRRLGRIKAAEEFAKTLKKIGIEKVETTTLPATGLFQPLMLINQKNYSSDYLKKDDQIFALRDRKFLRNNNTSQISSTNTPDVIDLKSLPHSEASAAPLNDEIDLNDPTATIVIHPGSNSIKIGFPKDDHPVVVPNCVAVPKKWLDLENSEHVENVCLQREQSEEFNNIKSEMEKNFRERMRLCAFDNFNVRYSLIGSMNGGLLYLVGLVICMALLFVDKPGVGLHKCWNAVISVFAKRFLVQFIYWVSFFFGGDDITRLFALFLLQSDFPLQDWKIDSKHGWLLAERLKKNFTTFQDADVAVQLYNFMNRSPNQPTEKYEFKLFDEVMLAPLALFFPQIFKLIRTSSHKNSSLEFQLPESRDLFTNELNDWNSLSQFESKEGNLYCDLNDDLKILNRILDAHNIIDQLQDKPENYGNTLKENFAPLEKAIVQSIANASITADVTRMNSFYSNILIVGGSSKIPALDFILTDRINIWRPSLLSSASFPQFYKKLTKEIKELEGHYVNAPDKTEDENKQILQAQIKEKIVEELEEQHQNIEHQNGNEHIFPVSIIPPPRDMNPALIIWKGASVLAQIKLVEELFITNSDWDVHGSRILQYKCIFTY
ncbi:Actin-like protein ARP8 [Saccharomyces cerevisiae]|nr:Actin-like protein ARP8 [Saccharomyces cerevisiae]